MDSLLSILIAMAVVALFAGTVAYLVLRRDLGRRRATFAAVGAGLTVGGSFLFVLYLGVVAFLVATGVYLVARLLLRVKAALIVMATTFGGLLAASVLALWVSVTYTM